MRIAFFCLEKKSTQHVFFDCVVARQCWSIMLEILGCKVGENMMEFGKYWLNNKKHCHVNIITSAIIWFI